MGKLDGKAALVTGGTNGIGAATARLLRSEGATVVATGSSARSAEAARKRMPEVGFVASDAGDAVAARALVEHVRAKHGRIDVVFANAGAARFTPFEDVDEETFDAMFGLLFRGPFFLLKHAVAAMPDGGSIILTSSIAAVRGLPKQSVYGAAKPALRSLGRGLAVELAPRRIRANAVIPGPIKTNIGAGLAPTTEQSKRMEEMFSRVPLRRMGEADEVAAAMLHFASDASAFTTGAELRVDGGFAAT